MSFNLSKILNTSEDGAIHVITHSGDPVASGTDHAGLQNLDYASSGHTGFQPSGDYATETNLLTTSGVLQDNINNKSDVSHNHSGLYEPANANIQSHISNTSNPHAVDEADILPSQAGNSGKFLTTDGSSSSWETVEGGGSTSPLTTKGDIWVYGSSDTRLGVGSSGYCLVPDSSTATGLGWGYPTGIRSGDGLGYLYASGSSSFVYKYGASTFIEFTTNGLKLDTGTTIDEFSTDGTLAGNSDDAVPTEKAVKTYVDGKKDKIEEGNSSVEVVDTGTGYVAVTVDGTETIRVETSKVGIGTNDPDNLLHLNSSTYPVLKIERVVTTPTATVWGTAACKASTSSAAVDGWGPGFYFMNEDSDATERLLGAFGGARDGADNSGKISFATYNAGTGYTRFYIRTDGTIEPGLDDAQDLGSSSVRWDDIYATNATIQTSDERLKDDIKSVNIGMDLISKLRPITFKWKDYTISGTRIVGTPDEPEIENYLIDKTFSRTHCGFSAQEFITTLSGLGYDYNNWAGVTYDAEADRYGVRIGELVPIIVYGMQEQQTRINELEATISGLVSRISALEGQ